MTCSCSLEATSLKLKWNLANWKEVLYEARKQDKSGCERAKRARTRRPSPDSEMTPCCYNTTQMIYCNNAVILITLFSHWYNQSAVLITQFCLWWHEDITKKTIAWFGWELWLEDRCASDLHILRSLEKQRMIYQSIKLNTSTESLGVVINALAW